MDGPFDDDDEQKRVVTSGGHHVGHVREVRGDRATAVRDVDETIHRYPRG